MTEFNNITVELFIIRNIEFFLVIDEFIQLFPFKKAVYKSTRFFGLKKFEYLSYRRLAIKAVLNVLFK
jgi:hypothetical protein